MSVECLKWAFGLNIPSTEKLVTLALSNIANDHDGVTWTAWPSFRLLSERSSLHPTTVKRAIKQLAEWGLISIKPRKALSKRSRSNFYILHIDRQAPQDIAERGSAALQTQDVEAESCDETIAYEGNESDVSLSATPHVDSSATSADLSQDSSATHVGTRPLPPNMNRKIETKTTPLSPPAPKTIYENSQSPPDEAERISDDYRELIEVYQQEGLIKFLGPDDKAWLTWQKLSVEQRARDKACLRNYLHGKKCQYREWNKSDKENRPRKPSPPASLVVFLRTRLSETIGIPIVPAEEDTDHDKRLCRQIIQRNAPGQERDYLWPFWHAENSPQFSQWELFFRAHGFSEAPKRAAKYSETDVMARAGLKAAAREGETGWRFPTEWPPEIDYETLQTQQESVHA